MATSYWFLGPILPRFRDIRAFLYILSYSRLFPNWHPIHPARVTITVSCINCVQLFELSMAFRFGANRRHGTDRRTQCNTSSARYQCTLAVRWQTSNNACSLLVLRDVRRQRRAKYVILRYFNIVNLWKIPGSRNNRCISIEPPSAKWHKMLTTCELQPRLSGLSKTSAAPPSGKISTTTPIAVVRVTSFHQSGCLSHCIATLCVSEQLKCYSPTPFNSFILVLSLI